MTEPVLETERLTLRPTALEDFPRWAELMAAGGNRTGDGA